MKRGKNMYKVTWLNEYGYRNAIECDTLAYANYYFKQKQTNEKVMVTLFENAKPLKFAEKVRNQWYVIELV